MNKETMEKKYKIAYILKYAKFITGAAVLLIGILVTGIVTKFSSDTLITYIMLTILAAFFAFGGVTLAESSIMKNIKKGIITELVKENCGDNAIYVAKGRDDYGEIFRHHMLKRPDRQSTEDYISATYRGIKYSISDVIFKERRETVDSKGNKQVDYVPYFQGRIMLCDVKNRGTDLSIIEKGSRITYSNPNSKEVQTEIININEKYKIRATNTVEVFKTFTPVMLAKLSDIENEYKAKFSYIVIGNRFYVFAENYPNSVELRSGKDINKAISALKKDLIFPKRVLDCFFTDKNS